MPLTFACHQRRHSVSAGWRLGGKPSGQPTRLIRQIRGQFMGSSTTSRWHEVSATAEAIAQAGGQLETSARHIKSTEELATAQEALFAITRAGARLARQLDLLANEYESPSLSEPSAVYVALDQAAAAAEDLRNCTKVAAPAIEDRE